MVTPKPLNRRQVLQTASLLGVSAAAMVTGDESQAASVTPYAANSGLVTGQMKPLKY